MPTLHLPFSGSPIPRLSETPALPAAGLHAPSSMLHAQHEYGLPHLRDEPIRATGPMAQENPFRFSTKRTDNTTDLVLYEHRAYSPGLGRWTSRDPMQLHWSSPSHQRKARLIVRTPRIPGEIRPYVFTDNEAVSHLDLLGLVVYLVHVPSTIPLVDHRMIFGNDGKGGSYRIDFAPRFEKCKRICGPGIIGYGADPKTSAWEAILKWRDAEGRGVRIGHWVATTDRVDAQLAQDAKDWYEKGQAPTFIAGFRDCNQFAWAWIVWARFLQDRMIEFPFWGTERLLVDLNMR